MTSVLTVVRRTIVVMARRYGYEIRRIGPPTEGRKRRMGFVESLGVDFVCDVGANDGAFATELRADGYRGGILSFEPGRAAFAALASRCASDPHWDCIEAAVGSSDGSAVLNIAGNSSSSSLLPMARRHREGAPGSEFVASEPVRVVRLDAIRPGAAGRRLFVKIDVQGLELDVIRGAPATLQDTVLVECELSLAELYVGQALLPEVVAALREEGFVLAGLDAVFEDARTRELLQVNGLFVRPCTGTESASPLRPCDAGLPNRG